MRKQEQQLWDTFKRNAPKSAWLRRVENVAGVGMPDVFGVIEKGQPFWVELKAPDEPKRASTRVLGDQGLNPDQVNWHLKAASMRLDSFILIRSLPSRELFLIRSAYAADLNDLNVQSLRELKEADNWSDIISELGGY